jgi:hypothetical protein
VKHKAILVEPLLTLVLDHRCDVLRVERGDTRHMLERWHLWLDHIRSTLDLSSPCHVSMRASGTISSVSIPKTIQDALSDLGWQKAMELEMTASH